MPDSPAPEKISSESLKRSTREQSERTITSKENKTGRRVVDSAMKMIHEDGPQPMKNMRPVSKTPNGADHFRDEHHGEYEARGQPSRDKIQRVEVHNNAYPKMYDELNKRETIAQPVAYPNRKLATTLNRTPGSSTCSLCIKRKQKQMLEHQKYKKEQKDQEQRKNASKRNKKRLQQSHKRPQKTQKEDDNKDIDGERNDEPLVKDKTRRTKTKITKPKRIQRRRRNSFMIANINDNSKSCQVTTYIISTKKNRASTYDDHRFLPTRMQERLPRNKRKYDYYRSENLKSLSRVSSKNSNIDSNNPETNSARSISSYNSFHSMEHEPMVE